jgi:uncharacterized protein YdhG (YjbR/CyaY superfamily)
MADEDGEPGRFSAQEKASMKSRAAELKADAKRAKEADKAAADAKDVVAKIAQMPEGDRQMAERLHELVSKVAPQLSPKLYYGQPGYALDGKVVVFFRSGQMNKLRYSTFGVSPHATLDERAGLWPTSWALTTPTSGAWDQLADVVRRAAGAD